MTYPELDELNWTVGLAARCADSAVLLKSLIADHRKSELRAGVFKRAQGYLGDPFYIPAGKCSYCAGGDETPLLREETASLYGRKSALIHVHEDPAPSCVECADEEYHEPWPCDFLRRVAKHYGVLL